MRSVHVAALLFVVAVACSRETPAPLAPPPAKPVVVRIDADVKTLNYVLHTEEAERVVLSFINEPLIALDENLNPVPSLAAGWDVSTDHRTYTIRLDPRATFSDGRPVLAADVLFTLNKILDAPSMQFSSWFESMDRQQTVAIDPRTVRVVFKTARVAQLLAFNIGVMPEHVYRAGDFATNPAVVGSGPYVLKRRDPNGILLEARADYWRQKPSIASFLFRPIADDGVAWRALMRGDVDIARITNDTWAHEKDKAEVRNELRFLDVWLLSYNCIAWHLRHAPFDDPRVRRALAVAFDRRAVITALYHGQARAVTGPFTPDQWASDPNVEAIAFDPQAARAALVAIGWRDTNGDGTLDRHGKPFAFTLLIPTGNVARDQATILQAALRDIGVSMQVSTMEGASFFDRVLHGNFEAAFFAWVNEPDPDPFSLFHSSQKAPAGLNVGEYASADADRLLEQARVEFDPARRAILYHQLHALLARDQPYLWMVQVSSKWGVNRRVQNVRASHGVGLFHHYPGPFAWRIQ
ncbi:MAG: ABC transporter substrate-binding protein [Acidobacteriota bacterium]